jgi:hypothetical protein
MDKNLRIASLILMMIFFLLNTVACGSAASSAEVPLPSTGANTVGNQTPVNFEDGTYSDGSATGYADFLINFDGASVYSVTFSGSTYIAKGSVLANTPDLPIIYTVTSSGTFTATANAITFTQESLTLTPS